MDDDIFGEIRRPVASRINDLYHSNEAMSIYAYDLQSPLSLYRRLDRMRKPTMPADPPM